MAVTDQVHVLVVDDEVELMTALCEALRDHGYASSGFTSGADALKALQEQDFELLLLDIMMPEMDGIEFLQRALKINPCLIGIMMTGYGTVQTAVKAMKVGAFDYILKPFKISLLLPVLSRAVEMRRLREENLHLRDLMTIYDISMVVSLKLNPDVILSKISDAVIDQCGADEVSILLPTRTNDRLYVAMTRGEQTEYCLGQYIPFEKDKYEGSDPHREITLLQRCTSDPAESIPHSPEIKSSLLIPLLVGGKCVGVLNVRSKKMSSFPSGKIKALKILANTAASALENARLYTEIRKAEQNYRSIFENASEGIFQVNRHNQYLLVNPSMARIMGYDNPEDLVPVHTGIDYVSLFGDDEMEITGIERQICRRDETIIWVSENVRAVRDDRGEIVHLEGTMEDITKHKEAERYEQELTRLDRLNLVGEMAASIGHEIRNPMTSVRGFLQMLSSKEDCKPYQGYYDLMIEELDRANSIISDYLNIAKDKPLDLTPGCLNTIINSLYPMIEADASYNDKQIELDLDDVPPVLMDEKEIRQLILNIARNGLEAMSTGRILTIGTRTEQDEAIMFIKDEGSGLDKTLINQLGTPFLTTKENGTGLGLAVCYRIANRHNAKIDVDTGPNGTTFWVRLPSLLEGNTLF